MEAQAAAPLGADDYSALRSLLTSDDASARTQGLALAKKLTPDEQKAFFTFQQQTNKGRTVNEATRPDRSPVSVGGVGVDPEFLIAGAVPIARAVGGAGLSMAGRAVAGAKAVVSQAAPTLKYEATKTALEKIGVPTPLAVVAAQAVAAYKFGGKAAEGPEEAATASAAPASAPVSAPVAPVPPAAEAASTVVPQSTATAPPSAQSPQQRLNEEAIAARRAKYQASIQPQAPADDVMQRLSPATAAAVQKPVLLASETKEFVRLIQAGKTQKEALAAIQVQRDLQAQLGLKTPTAAETRFPKGNRGKVPGDDE